MPAINPSSAPSGLASDTAKPINPYLVLAASIALPGFGYVLLGQTRRGFTMQMFMIVFAFVTWHFAQPETSLIGKLAGGIFIYALSIPETYRTARLRWVAWNEAHKS